MRLPVAESGDIYMQESVRGSTMGLTKSGAGGTCNAIRLPNETPESTGVPRMPQCTIPTAQTNIVIAREFSHAGERATEDLIRFVQEWWFYRPKDKRRQWAYVYLADMGTTRLCGFEGQHLHKIGVSARPWSRMREIRAHSIVMSRWVYRPFTLETALHQTFASRSPRVISYIRNHTFQEYEDNHRLIGTGEEFMFGPDEIAFVRRILDFWQLMSPMRGDGECPSIGGAKNFPRRTIWEYDSETWTGEYFTGGLPCPKELAKVEWT